MSVLRDNVNLGPAELRRQMADFVTAAGVFNGISAQLAERGGFRALYLSGSGVAGGAMGLPPDLSVTTLTELAEECRRITSVARSPLIVDADTGFGEAINVIRTVRLLEAAGASAIHIEDQVMPKRCGHLEGGKKVIGAEEMGMKVRAAVEARKDEDFVIIARTDARAVNGFQDAVERAKFYLDCGADMIFIEALESEEEFRQFAREVDGPLLANMTEFGKSPLLSAQELKSLGYRAVIFPLTAFRAALKAMDSVYRDLFRAGTQRGFVDSLMTRKEFYSVIGYDQYAEDDSGIFREVQGGMQARRGGRGGLI